MAADVLEIYLADIRQLFNSMDPAPFRERDLDPNAADYIVEWAEELPASARWRSSSSSARRSAPGTTQPRSSSRSVITSSGARQRLAATCATCCGSGASAC